MFLKPPTNSPTAVQPVQEARPLEEIQREEQMYHLGKQPLDLLKTGKNTSEASLADTLSILSYVPTYF